jgi:O-antigen/teichoic acid export membrane protein
LRSIAQFLAFLKVALRERIAGVYKRNADTVAQQIIVVFFFCIPGSVVCILVPDVLYRFQRESTAVKWAILFLPVFFAMNYLLDGQRAEKRAAEARARWPLLTRHALAAILIFCFGCLTLFVLAATYMRAHHHS